MTIKFDIFQLLCRRRRRGLRPAEVIPINQCPITARSSRLEHCETTT